MLSMHNASRHFGSGIHRHLLYGLLTTLLVAGAANGGDLAVVKALPSGSSSSIRRPEKSPFRVPPRALRRS